MNTRIGAELDSLQAEVDVLKRLQAKAVALHQILTA